MTPTLRILPCLGGCERNMAGGGGVSDGQLCKLSLGAMAATLATSPRERTDGPPLAYAHGYGLLGILLAIGCLFSASLSAATNVLVSTGTLRDAAGNALPSGALVVLVASTVDATFSPPRAAASLQVGQAIADDDIVIATWEVDAVATGVAGGAYRLVTFDYAKMAIPNFGPGDKLMLYWFPGATLVNPIAMPNAPYGSFRTDAINSRSNIGWTAPIDTSGATLALGFLTDNIGGETSAALANATTTVDSGSGAPVIFAQPLGQTATAGSTVTLSVTSTGTAPLSYQWSRAGVSIADATQATLTLSDIKTTDAGNYTVTVSNTISSITSAVAAVVVNPSSTIARGVSTSSTRAAVGAGAMILSGAFTIEGGASKQMLVRAVGPSLATFSVSGVLPDPRLEIINASTGAVISSNDDWSLAANAAQIAPISSQVGAFALSSGSKDAVILATLPPGTYRARVLGAAGSTGVAQLEIFEADTTPRLVYLATRAMVGAGQNAFVQGFMVETIATSRSYLIRALGPSLGLPAAINDPALAVYSTASVTTPVASNDNWINDATLANVTASVGAMALPGGSKDAALNFTPTTTGVYTVQVTGAAGATGLALLEIFEADSQRSATIPAAIVSPPEAVSVITGQPATFAVVSVGKPAPTYQWRKNSIAISGATGAMYTISSAQSSDAGSYDVVVTNPGSSATSPAAALVVSPSPYHSADTNADFRIGLVELTRVIELYNSRNGTIRTGCYAVATSATEDAFAVDPARSVGAIVTLAKYHSADSNRDGKLGLSELTRVIELYNFREGTTRTGQYRVQTNLPTEDGFAPGP